MKFKENLLDKIAKIVFVFGLVLAILAMLIVMGSSMSSVTNEEKIVVILKDKRVDTGIVRAGVAAISSHRFIYVLDDEGYKFEKMVDENSFGWFEKGDRIVVMKSKTEVRIFGIYIREKVDYKFFNEG